MKKALKLPVFKNEEEERAFWSDIDLTEFVDVKDLQPIIFPNLKPTSQPISLRLPTFMLQRLKEKANSMAVPYQALIKEYIEVGLQK